jgi:hypothetical protein
MPFLQNAKTYFIKIANIYVMSISWPKRGRRGVRLVLRTRNDKGHREVLLILWAWQLVIAHQVQLGYYPESQMPLWGTPRAR